MAVFFKPQILKTSKDENAEVRYFARVKSISTLDEEELVSRISERTGLANGVVASVLRDSMTEVVNLVTLGYNVQLPSLGIVYLTFRSKSSPTAEEVTTDSVKKFNIRLHPSTLFKNKVQAKVKIANFNTVVLGEENDVTNDPGSEPSGGGNSSGGGGGNDNGDNPL